MLDVMALTETKMIKHEAIYSSISKKKWKSFSTDAIETKSGETLGRKGGVTILIKEYLAEHTVILQTGIEGYLVAIKIRLPKAVRALVIVASYNPPNGLDDRNHILREVAERVKEIKEEHSRGMLVWMGDMNMHIGDVAAYRGMDGPTNLDMHHAFDAKRSERSEMLLRDLISTKGGMEVMNGKQGKGSQQTVRHGGIRDLIIINKEAKSAHLLTVPIPESMRQKFAWGGHEKDKIRTRHIPVITILNIKRHKQTKASYKHHSI